MHIVLLSGGAGKRLWPLSNEALSKQFLKILKKPNGEHESMVQRVMRQIMETNPNSNVYVSCGSAQTEVLGSQLGNIETILVPSRRDTFPAIALAAAYLHYVKKLDKSETFVVCPIDHFVSNKYFERFSKVEELVKSGQNAIGTLGTVPTHPSDSYGYILRDGEKVIKFVEKPTINKAEELMRNNALWNCGVFAFRIGYILDRAKEHMKFDSFDTFYNRYTKLPKISIDFEVIEKEPSIGCAVYDELWKDIGTWDEFASQMSEPFLGNNVFISECENTHVLNMLDIPVIANDLESAVVVVGYDGILVSSKKGASNLKSVVDKIHLRPMYEQRRWGDYRVLEYKRDNGVSSLVKRIHMNVGQSMSYQYHEKRNEALVIISGKAIITIDDVDSVVAPGDVIPIPPKTKHTLLAATDFEFIEVQLGTSELEEEDIVRLT